LHRLLFGLVEAIVGPESAPGLHDDLTCFCETKTALVNADLLRLAALAASSSAVSTKLEATPSQALWKSGALEEFPEFHAAFQRFLEDHGHRETDFDAYHPTWCGQPWVVLDHLRLLLDQAASHDGGPERDVAARYRQQSAENRFLEAVPQRYRFLVAEVLRLTRVYTGLDDLEHYETTRLTVPFRNTLIELGRRLVTEAILDEARDIFFLTKEEVASYVGGNPTVDTRAQALQRKAEYQEQLRCSPPHTLGETDALQADVTGGLTGVPGSPGTAEGPVFRVLSAEDFGRFPTGSVLVARTTNPAWTPLFYSAVAIITESGGPLSHGAVTARELGLPAVMGVRGALASLNDGDSVRVHGGAGVVERI
jgi:pyruvate,water dikinase